MARRYYRRKSKTSIISDTVYIGARLPWWGTLAFGVLVFVIFYFVIPVWIENKILVHGDSPMLFALSEVMNRRIHWFQYLGIACGLVCAFFAIRNFFIAKSASYPERGIIGLIARLLGREIN
jgi:hypothetical protein